MLYPTLKETRLTSRNKIEPAEVWKIVVNIRKHFDETNFNAVKYNFNGLKNLDLSKAVGSRAIYPCTKLARNYPDRNEVIKYCAANNAVGNTWINDMTDEPYQQLNAKLQSMAYIFKNDLKQFSTFNEMFEIDQMPKIVNKLLEGSVTLETVAILDYILDFTTTLDKDVTDVLVWPSQKSLIRNYRAFIPLWINIKKMKKVALSVFTKGN